VRADQLGEAIASHYKASVFVFGEIAAQKITGTLTSGSIEDALDVLGFMIGAQWRLVGNIYFVGGSEDEIVTVLPRGALPAAPGAVFGAKVAAIGDKLVIREEAGTSGQLEQVVSELNRVEGIKLRLLVLDVSKEDLEAFNQFLEAFELGAIIEAGVNQARQSTFPVSAAFKNNHTGADVLGYTMETTATVAAILDFLPSLNDSDVSVDTEITVPSGTKVSFTAGQVVERDVNTQVAGQETASFRTGFDEREVGFSIDLESRRIPGGWFVETEVEDSSLESLAVERRATYKGSLVLRDADRGAKPVIKFKRTESIKQEQKWRLFTKLRKSLKVTRSRNITIMVEVIERFQMNAVEMQESILIDKLKLEASKPQ